MRLKLLRALDQAGRFAWAATQIAAGATWAISLGLLIYLIFYQFMVPVPTFSCDLPFEFDDSAFQHDRQADGAGPFSLTTFNINPHTGVQLAHSSGAVNGQHQPAAARQPTAVVDVIEPAELIAAGAGPGAGAGAGAALHSALTPGQQYIAELQLHIPATYAVRSRGRFNVHVELFSQRLLPATEPADSHAGSAGAAGATIGTWHTQLLARCSVPASLTYRPLLFEAVWQLVTLPAWLVGLHDPSAAALETVTVQCFTPSAASAAAAAAAAGGRGASSSGGGASSSSTGASALFVESRAWPLTRLVVRLGDPALPALSGALHLRAAMRGLPRLMYDHWLVTGAVITLAAAAVAFTGLFACCAVVRWRVGGGWGVGLPLPPVLAPTALLHAMGFLRDDLTTMEAEARAAAAAAGAVGNGKRQPWLLSLMHHLEKLTHVAEGAQEAVDEAAGAHRHGPGAGGAAAAAAAAAVDAAGILQRRRSAPAAHIAADRTALFAPERSGAVAGGSASTSDGNAAQQLPLQLRLPVEQRGVAYLPSSKVLTLPLPTAPLPLPVPVPAPAPAALRSVVADESEGAGAEAQAAVFTAEEASEGQSAGGETAAEGGAAQTGVRRRRP